MLPANFATGRAQYTTQGLHDRTSRIIVQARVGECPLPMPFMVDTGAPWCMLTREVAEEANLIPSEFDHPEDLRTARWGVLQGRIVRGALLLPAAEGKDLLIEGTFFVPDGYHEVDGPLFIGLSGALERMRWAVDPANENIYFGHL